MKTDELRRSRELRAEGRSVTEIARLLGVSKSSVSHWVRDVELSEAQRHALAARIRWGPIVSGERHAAAARATRRAYQNAGRQRARQADASYMAGCMLYWAEGRKARNTLKISNSDPDLLAFFARFLRKHFQLTDEQLRVYCNLFPDHLEHQHEIEAFWLSKLDLPPTSLRKSIVNTYSKYSQKKRVNKLPYGTCALVVNSTRIVQTIYGSIQEYAGFERPEWLD